MADFDGNYANPNPVAGSGAIMEVGSANGNIPSIGSVADTTPPYITNINPMPGTTMLSRSEPISMDVLDLDPGVQVVILTIKYAHRVETQVVYDGSNFLSPFNNAASQTLVIANGIRLIIVPENQWLGDIESFFVYAIDNAGNVEGLP